MSVSLFNVLRVAWRIDSIDLRPAMARTMAMGNAGWQASQQQPPLPVQPLTSCCGRSAHTCTASVRAKIRQEEVLSRHLERTDVKWK